MGQRRLTRVELPAHSERNDNIILHKKITLAFFVVGSVFHRDTCFLMILQKVVCLGKYESKPVERLKLNYSLTKGVENCQDSSKFSKLELASTRLVIIIQYEKNFSDSTHKLAKTRLKSLK